MGVPVYRDSFFYNRMGLPVVSFNFFHPGFMFATCNWKTPLICTKPSNRCAN